MKQLSILLSVLLVLTLTGCDKDDPASPDDQRPNFENSEGYNLAFYNSTVPQVPERFSRLSESTTLPTTVAAMLWSAHDTVGVDGETNLVDRATVVLDGNYELPPDGSFEYFSVVFSPIFEVAIEDMFTPGSVHTLSIDSPVWGDYSFELVVPDEIELHPYDTTGLNPGDLLQISWDWVSESDYFEILDGDSLTVKEYDAGSQPQPDPSYSLTYQPGSTVVIGIHHIMMDRPDEGMENSIVTALYQELIFEW